MSVLYLFTEYFPTGHKSKSEHAFLKNEVVHLQNVFEKVVIVPQKKLSNISEAVGYTVDYSLSEELRKMNKMMFVLIPLFSIFFYRELFRRGIFFWDRKKIIRLIYFIGQSYQTKKWITRKLNGGTVLQRQTLLYTYWKNEITYGLLLSSFKNVVTRAHGYDLYEERHGYLPFEYDIVKKIKRFYLVSDAAKRYLEKKYPEFSHKLEVRSLGVLKAAGKPSFSNDDKVRIVSCSYIIPLKRVELIFEGIEKFSEMFHKQVQWVHFGGGYGIKALKHLIKKRSSNNIECQLKGNTENSKILSYYEKNSIDMFILTSSTEGGIPVVLQEAQAHGIPVIGTKVGGIPEIVHDNVGVLISKDPTAEEIARAINHIISDKERFLEMRKNSYLNWESNFNAEKNYSSFSVELKKLLQEQ